MSVPPVSRSSDASVDLDAAALGARLRELRETRGLSLRSLAGELGISPSAVSQIERGARRPSVSRLLTIVQVLGVPLADVFDSDRVSAPAEDGAAPPRGVVVARAGEARPVVLDDGVVFRRLSPGNLRGVDFFESTYPPGSSATGVNDLITHEGYEVGTVVSGELTIDFPDERVSVGTGDSVTFPCDLPHRLGNLGAVDAVATWLIVHPGA
ncbi:helix-turn-helix domain-containing protein [Frigoribacterium faeni]|uniref:Transcriptional regulator n=1 Tax=Frigoribacterium faeni TaxID=145483 RepID=A0ABQ0UKH0_9MICO|nr:helix-turn-helix domain-containing protein [Frigoribacterium faeni]BFF14096.1 cupin domain-containing protein [Microbacterium flavescens]GEK81979.1 transcriptional regulator [Frigoribacterium faeni]